MSDWKKGFYQAIKEFAGLPEDAEVLYVEESVQIFSGCETCGPDYAYSTDITYKIPGETRNQYKFLDISIANFINSL